MANTKARDATVWQCMATNPTKVPICSRSNTPGAYEAVVVVVFDRDGDGVPQQATNTRSKGVAPCQNDVSDGTVSVARLSCFGGWNTDTPSDLHSCCCWFRSFVIVVTLVVEWDVLDVVVVSWSTTVGTIITTLRRVGLEHIGWFHHNWYNSQLARYRVAK